MADAVILNQVCQPDLVSVMALLPVALSPGRHGVPRRVEGRECNPAGGGGEEYRCGMRECSDRVPRFSAELAAQLLARTTPARMLPKAFR